MVPKLAKGKQIAWRARLCHPASREIYPAAIAKWDGPIEASGVSID
jgi:hypothetical protein